jgi:Tol biopolymer transport system component
MDTACPLAILDHEAPATQLAFSPDGNLLAVVTENNQVGCSEMDTPDGNLQW